VDLYLDDCLDSDRLAALLTKAGHRVVTPRAAGTRGQSDDVHLEYAGRHGLALITRNADDFRDLHDLWHAEGRVHPGIWLVFLDNIKGKDMQPSEIVRAIGNLLASGVPIVNEIHTLNHWR
jgi:predicted nuclease of predicted toxin-antitoxin system